MRQSPELSARLDEMFEDLFRMHDVEGFRVDGFVRNDGDAQRSGSLVLFLANLGDEHLGAKRSRDARPPARTKTKIEEADLARMLAGSFEQHHQLAGNRAEIM